MMRRWLQNLVMGYRYFQAGLAVSPLLLLHGSDERKQGFLVYAFRLFAFFLDGGLFVLLGQQCLA